MLPPGTRSPVADTVLLLDICRDDYSFSELNSSWEQIVPEMVCPACSERGCFARHGSYTKYYYAKQIKILRLRCRGCRRTHALLPSFSLPGTSIGTEEAEAYLAARERGVGRGRTRRELQVLGVGGEYGKRLQKMLAVAVSRAKAAVEHEIPYLGVRRLSEACIRKWLYAYRRHGRAGLEPKMRRDAGRCRSLSASETALLTAELEKHPELAPPRFSRDCGGNSVGRR